MSAKDELKKLVSDFRTEYEQRSADSRERYISALPAYTPVPPEGALYGDDAKSSFKALGIEYQHKASAIIDAQRKKLEDEYTRAPSTDAMNAITAISGRKDLTQSEVNALMEEYGDNHLAAYAIAGAAKDSGIRLDGSVPRLDDQLTRLDDLERNLRSKFTLSGAMTGSGFDSLLEMAIDRAPLDD